MPQRNYIGMHRVYTGRTFYFVILSSVKLSEFVRLQPYRRLNRLIESESLEPNLSWGVRMAIAGIIPVIWGVATNQMAAASWITLTAECICWVELKGSFAQRIRVLLAGIGLALVFGFLGSVTGTSLWLSLTLMLVVGFLSGLFKNLGDRGSGLAICVYVVFILCNAYPTHSTSELQERLTLIFIGGAWNFVIGLAASMFIKAQEPYRRTIALIWKANGSLINAIAKGWDGSTTRNNIRNIYLKEKEVRTAIDNSFHFYETMAHQVSEKDVKKYEIAQFRKATALVATHIEALSEELENIKIREVDEELRIKIHNTLRALEETADRMAVYVIVLKAEEELLLASRLTKFNKSILLLKEHPLPPDHPKAFVFKRIVQLLERTLRLIENALTRLEQISDDMLVVRSYSMMKTLVVLHPKHWLRNARLLFNLNIFTTRYSLRIAVAVTVAMFIYKWFNIDHGYWLPFTVLTVTQPYFGATLRKGFDRVLGTVAGGVVGGLLIRLPTGMYVQETMLALCFVLMVYFIRKRYAVAVFFITVSLVLLFDVEETVNPMLIATRALSTIGGATLAIVAGFALLPDWDKKWLPVHLSNAINCNYNYFIATFYPSKPIMWIRHKRNAESKNSNAFDSFTRYMQEPAIKKKPYISFYQLITHNVRITRELNNIHLEQESRGVERTGSATPEQQRRIDECLLWFNKIEEELKEFNTNITTEVIHPDPGYISTVRLSSHQLLYLEKLLIELKAVYQGIGHIGDLS
jgi:uncharacterized membrane protein YccC